jgi:hypothetical protein
MNTRLELLIKQLTDSRTISLTSQLLAGTFLGKESRETQVLKSFRPKDIPNPFKDLPNVKRLWISTNVLDPLLKRLGIAKKLSPELRFDRYNHRVAAANRYLRIMHYRLCKLLSQGDTHGYWILALMLMHKSHVLHQVALRKREPNWYKEVKLAKVLSDFKLLDALIQNHDSSLPFSRFYADKVKSDGTKTYRPLANPKDHVKMYQYLWQSFFVIFLYSYIGKYQHGFLPGRGVNTALPRLTKMFKMPYVWEFDLEGAFPSLNVEHTCDRLIEVGCPAPIANLIRSQSVTTQESITRPLQKLPEPKEDIKAAISSLVGSENTWKYSGSASMFMQFAMRDMPAFSPPHAEEAPAGLVPDVPTTVRAVLAEPGPNALIRGFPQGSALSPILFDFAFEDGLVRGHFDRVIGKDKYSITAYADDFILSSTKDIPNLFSLQSPALDAYGFKISLTKSRPAKVHGL